MIKYYYLSKRIFDEDLLKRETHWQFILNLTSYLKKGLFNLVVIGDWYDYFLKNKNLITNNVLRLKIEKNIKINLRKKIRFLKKEIKDLAIYTDLIEYPSFDKFIELDSPKNKKNKSIFFDSLYFDIYRNENSDLLEQGKLFNKFEEIEFEKLFLGSSVIDITVYNFIDNIFDVKFDDRHQKYNFEKFLNKSENQIKRSKITFSMNYLCCKILNARDEKFNFLDFEKRLILNINCRSSRNEKFFYKYEDEFNDFLKNYINKELLLQESIRNFIDLDGDITLNIYPQFAKEGYSTLDAEETHQRYMQCENGVFSIAKDFDMYDTEEQFNFLKRTQNIEKYRKGTIDYTFLENLSFKKKPIRIGFSSEAHPFIASGYPQAPPISKKFNDFLS